MFVGAFGIDSPLHAFRGVVYPRFALSFVVLFVRTVLNQYNNGHWKAAAKAGALIAASVFTGMAQQST